MISLSNLSRDVTSEASARLVYYLSSAAVIVFLSRRLEPSAYGTLFLAISVLTVFRLFSSLGLAKSAARYVSSYTGVDDGQIRHVVVRSLRYNLVTIAVVTGVAVAGAGPIAAALGNPALEPLLVVGGCYIVAATLYNYTRVVLQGFQAIGASATVYASEGIGRIVGVLLLVSLGYELFGALVGFILGFAIAAILGVWLLYRRLPSAADTDPIEDGLERRLLRYSLPLAVTRGAWVLDREIDLILVGYLLESAVVGYYAIGKQVVTFCSGMAGSIGFSLGPQFDESTVSKSTRHARRTYETVLTYVLLVYVPAVAGLAILAEPVVTAVFGAAYQDAVPILQVFCAAIILMSITELTEDILDYLGRANTRAVFKIATSGGNVVLSVLLIRSFGAVGAAVATVCMQAIYAGLCLFVVKSEIGLRTRHLLTQTARILGITAVMSAVVVFLTRYVSGPLTIGATILSGVVVWGLLAVMTGFVSPASLGNIGLSEQN
ncbi:flippase [Halohasta salina]|uniref:flippase n=1 Tax=Halohasta salina TaxID=2961621 RepID=UPI0020A5B895|nr:flippase [Halohasta salina]